MRLVRTMLAMVIAAALAVLPVGVSASGFAMPSDAVHAGMQLAAADVQLAAADMAMDDCCPDDMKGAPSHTADYKCGMGFCCAGGMIALAEVRAVRSELPPTAGSTVAIPPDQIV